MSDKNPYYSIPKPLGEPREEIDMLPPPEVAVVLAKLVEDMNRQIWDVLTGAGALTSPRPTALRLTPSGGFEVVKIDDHGKVIEPPRPCPRCGPVLLCAEHMAMVT